ncbi:MAG TPA: hypothetical protein VHY20_12045, partial [Pirellulales bacterium]|nr:hypothetical protein [Pirellulales bacterium]
ETNPKRCHLQVTWPTAVNYYGIYLLEGDKLRLARPRVGTSGGSAYATSLDPGPGRRTYVFRRANETAGATSPQPPLNEREAEALTDLRKALAAAAETLEAGRSQEYVERYIAPLDEPLNRSAAKQLATQPMTADRIRSVAKFLRILAAEQPTFDADATRATFDIRSIHVNGLSGGRTHTWAKTGNKWCMSLK